MLIYGGGVDLTAPALVRVTEARNKQRVGGRRSCTDKVNGTQPPVAADRTCSSRVEEWQQCGNFIFGVAFTDQIIAYAAGSLPRPCQDANVRDPTRIGVNFY